MTTETTAAKPGENQPTTGPFGQFLKDHGINSTPLAASSGVETIELDGKDLGSALRLLRNSAEVKLDFLVTVSGVDSQDTFDSVYHLWSYSNKNELVVKVRLAKANLKPDYLPTVMSLAPFWQAANWHERETHDFFGIQFVGHPNLTPFLLPEDATYHPLKKDFTS